MNRIKYFEDLIIRCEFALIQNPNMIPLEWIINQLKYLIEVEKGNVKDISDLENIKIGWIAVREMDGYEDKDLIDSLCIVSKEVEKMILERKLNNEKKDATIKTKVLIGQPFDYPKELIEYINTLLDENKDIQLAYLACVQYLDPESLPKLFIGLEAIGDFKKIIANLKEHDKENFMHAKFEFTDAKNGPYKEYFLKIKPFYIKK